MKNKTTLSTIALFAAVLAVPPASALTLNLGGGASGGSSGGAAVTVDTGNLLGGGDGGSDTNTVVDLDLNGSGSTGSGGVLDLGGTGALIDLDADNDENAVIDLNLGTARGPGLLDLGGGDGILLDLGDGPLLDLSGGEQGTLLALGEGGLLDMTSTGSIGGSGNALLQLGSDGDLLDFGDGNLLDLGSGERDATASFGDTDLIADLNLEGDDEPTVQVYLLSSRRGTVGTGGFNGSDGLVTMSGSKPETTSFSGNGDDGSVQKSMAAASTDSADAAGGDDPGGTGTGTGTGAAAPGAGTAGSATAGSRAASGAATQTSVATSSATSATVRGTTDQSGCLNLTADQMNQLVNRHVYDWNTFSSWADAKALRVIEVDVCGNITSQVDLAVDSSANVARLQTFLAGQAKVRDGLQQTGHTPDDVIAADGDGDELVVYVTNG